MDQHYRKVIENAESVIQSRSEDVWYQNDEEVRTVAIEMAEDDIFVTIYTSEDKTDTVLTQLIMRNPDEKKRQNRILLGDIPPENYYKVTAETGQIKDWFELE